MKIKIRLKLRLNKFECVLSVVRNPLITRNLMVAVS
jgi:hypothetical protein